MLFDSRCIYTMPPQTQKQYWQDQWDQRDFEKQVASAQNKAWWEMLVDLLEDVGPEEWVVEAGCGLGQFVYRLHQMGHRVTGVDITDSTLDRVRASCPELDLRAMDVRALDFADASIKLMLSLGVLEHFEEGPDDLLREAARVIEPGGVLFATVPYSNVYRRLREPWRRAGRALGRGIGIASVRDTVFYQYTYSRRDMVRRMAQHGFRVESTLLHHTHVALRKDLEGNWLYRVMHRRWSRGKPMTPKTHREWAGRLDGLSPKLMSHICLYVARRVEG